VEGVGRYRRLATTIDDALGEAFDKTAKILGLGYPGGPAVERLALAGRSQGRAPAPPAGRRVREPHFSFAGLKSAVLRAVESGAHGRRYRREFPAGGGRMPDRPARAMRSIPGPFPALVVAGGVAANKAVRAALEAFAAARDALHRAAAGPVHR
jgi:N6-L-threonylcarbamoyladenine synthase